MTAIRFRRRVTRTSSWVALLALARVSHRQTVTPSLRRGLGDSHWFVRAMAAKAWGFFADQVEVPPAAFSDRDHFVRRQARIAVMEIERRRRLN